VRHELAQVNVARLEAPLESPLLHDFVAALDPVNAAADAAPGFRWRLQTDAGNATGIRAFEWDTGASAGVIVNLSVWDDVESLAAFVYGDVHRAVLRSRRTWFERMVEAHTCCWWVPAGHRPSTDEAEARLLQLRRHGPTEHSFTLRHSFTPPAVGVTPSELRGRDDWLCNA
jgi:hypothetical protein